MLQFMKELFRSVATIAIVVAVAMGVCLVAMQCKPRYNRYCRRVHFKRITIVAVANGLLFSLIAMGMNYINI